MMKKISVHFYSPLVILFFFLIFVSGHALHAQEQLDPNTGFPVINPKPFIIFNEGVSWASVTRIQKQDSRSNFVFRDDMIGAFFGIQTKNMQPCNSIVRIAAYYPYHHTFNEVPQDSMQTILYGCDIFAAPLFETDMWKYVRIHFAPGIHFLYQLSDNWNYIDLGLGAQLGLELPVAWHWTILVNGFATADYGNLGSNKNMMPFDYCWEYQLELGLRYSRKAPNEFSYINSKKRAKAAQKTADNTSAVQP